MARRRKHVSQWQARDALGCFSRTPSKTKEPPRRSTAAVVGARSSTNGPNRGRSAVVVGRPCSRKGPSPSPRRSAATVARPSFSKGRARAVSAAIGGRTSTKGPSPRRSTAAVTGPSFSKGQARAASTAVSGRTTTKGPSRHTSGLGAGRRTSSRAVPLPKSPNNRQKGSITQALCRSSGKWPTSTSAVVPGPLSKKVKVIIDILDSDEDNIATTPNVSCVNKLHLTEPTMWAVSKEVIYIHSDDDSTEKYCEWNLGSIIKAKQAAAMEQGKRKWKREQVEPKLHHKVTKMEASTSDED